MSESARACAEAHMREAMSLARDAAEAGSRPFGAVIVDGHGRVVARERNRVAEGDPSAHAELLAIQSACRERNTSRLIGFEVYTNAEPCPMCFSAMAAVEISDLYYAAPSAPGTWPMPLEELARDSDAGSVRLHPGLLHDEAVAQLLLLDPAR